jgi:ABC-type multidrug transport system fused ATPase/permease subunit
VPSLASLADGLCKIVPAALILEIFRVIFTHFQTGEPLGTGRMWLVACILIAWLLVQYIVYAFAYEDHDVLKNVSFTIEPRTVTALVGPSGSGKSTVTRLIARFWDVQGGCIRIGGRDIREIDPEKLLSRISMVFQDVYLFKDTIGNNIRVGQIDASQEEVEAAARQACCHDFIKELPQGYDTPVGEGGCALSDGEKQRISIARALLKNAPIVLLDEATASLDPENETNVQRAINALVVNKYEEKVPDFVCGCNYCFGPKFSCECSG